MEYLSPIGPLPWNVSPNLNPNNLLHFEFNDMLRVRQTISLVCFVRRVPNDIKKNTVEKHDSTHDSHVGRLDTSKLRCIVTQSITLLLFDQSSLLAYQRLREGMP